MVMYVGPSGYTKDLRTLRLCLQDFGFDGLGPGVGGYGFRGCGASCLHFGCSATTHFVRANGVRGDHSDNCFIDLVVQHLLGPAGKLPRHYKTARALDNLVERQRNDERALGLPWLGLALAGNQILYQVYLSVLLTKLHRVPWVPLISYAVVCIPCARTP